MKKAFLTGSTLLAMAFGAVAAEDLTAQLERQTDCKAVAEIVSKALEGKTSEAAIGEVVTVLDTAMSAKSACACEIVTAAIEATGANAADKGYFIEVIVETAVKAVPEKTATIAECAVAAAPDHAALIDKVLTRIFEQNDEDYLGEGSGKQGYGKEAPPTVVDTTEEDDFVDWGASLPAPVYLIAPSGGIIGSGDLFRFPMTPADPIPTEEG